MLKKLRFRLVLASAATLLFPLTIPNIVANSNWLWVILGVNIAAYVAVAVMTVLSTLDIAGDGKPKHDHASLTLGQQWTTALRENVGWHVAAGAARFGLALSLAGYLYYVCCGDNQFQGVLAPFFYQTLNNGVGFNFTQIETAIIGVIVMMIFAIAETGLLVGFTLAARHYVSGRWQVVAAVAAVRVSIIVGIIGVMLVVQSGYAIYERMPVRIPETGLSSVNAWLDDNLYHDKLVFLHRVAFSTMDAGTMLATDMMRPLGGVPCLSSGYGGYRTDGSYYASTACLTWDNRPFVLERLFIGWNGLQVYAVMIGLALLVAWKRPVLSRRREQDDDARPMIV